jgi:hypothetical protein
MVRSSDSTESSDDSHFTGRPPPPYHLVDVMKRFSFSYATSSAPESDENGLCAVYPRQEQPSTSLQKEPLDSSVRVSAGRAWLNATTQELFHK